MTDATIQLWGRDIGAVALDEGERFARFEYAPEFVRSGIEVAPLQMPLAPGVFSFVGLNPESFNGLPGMLADSLPDRFGNALIDAWLASQGRTPGSLNAVERLCYVGKRGMGALEFVPSTGPAATPSHELDVSRLAELAAEALSNKEGLVVSLADSDTEKAFQEILRVGSSAGGARPKALISFNPTTQEVRSGQLDAEPGFEHWILKFDGIDDETREFGTGQGYGATEFVYSQLAGEAGIEMSECRLFEEGDRRHFLTRRFDRPSSDKLHMESLAAMQHLDFRDPSSNSYEHAFLAIRQLELPMNATEQMFRRMVFNVVARNQDDHVKNIAFLMNQAGEWSLAPAFDVTYAYSPSGTWTAQHQMSINGKRDDFRMEDFRQVAESFSMKRGRAEAIVDEVTQAVRKWPELAAAAHVTSERISKIKRVHRLDLATN